MYTIDIYPISSRLVIKINGINDTTIVFLRTLLSKSQIQETQTRKAIKVSYLEIKFEHDWNIFRVFIAQSRTRPPKFALPCYWDIFIDKSQLLNINIEAMYKHESII